MGQSTKGNVQQVYIYNFYGVLWWQLVKLMSPILATLARFNKAVNFSGRFSFMIIMRQEGELIYGHSQKVNCNIHRHNYNQELLLIL